MKRRWNQKRIAILAAWVMPWAGGCTQPEGGNHWFQPAAQKSANEGPVESNIVRVTKFFSSEPWVCFAGDGNNRVDGVRFAVYLESSTRPKGVFGTGTIVVSMYRIHRDSMGREAADKVHEWELPAVEADRFRATKATMMGWGYGLRLQWPKDLDVEGRQVAFIVRYVREDGRVINSSRQVLRVPMSTGPALPLS